MRDPRDHLHSEWQTERTTKYALPNVHFHTIFPNQPKSDNLNVHEETSHSPVECASLLMR